MAEFGKIEDVGAAANAGAKDETASRLLESSKVWTAPPANGKDSFNIELATMAEQLKGQPLWLDHAEVTQNGKLGAMAAVSKVIQLAHGDEGMKDFDRLSVKDGALELGERKWTAVQSPKPGDVAIALYKQGGGNAGIVAMDGETILSNRSNTGQWTGLSVDKFKGSRPLQEMLYLRAPENLHAIEITDTKK